MSLLLDAGAFIAIERHDRLVITQLERERLAGRSPLTHGGIIGQVWRGTARQARLAKAMKGVEVVPLDFELGRKSGELLRKARAKDVLDAALVLLARDDDRVLTSDPDDLAALAEAAGVFLELIVV